MTNIDSPTPLSDAALERFHIFKGEIFANVKTALNGKLSPSEHQSFESWSEAIEHRCHDGRRRYGDKSFTRSPLELVREVMEEIADIPGWSWILAQHQDLSAGQRRQVITALAKAYELQRDFEAIEADLQS